MLRAVVAVVIIIQKRSLVIVGTLVLRLKAAASFYVTGQCIKTQQREVYFTTLLRQNSGRQNGLSPQILFSELYTFTVNTVIFVGFRWDGRLPGFGYPHLWGSNPQSFGYRCGARMGK